MMFSDVFSLPGRAAMDALDLLLAVACFGAGYALRAAISQLRRRQVRRLRARNTVLGSRLRGQIGATISQEHLAPIEPAIHS
jgi:hypothetical protein